MSQYCSVADVQSRLTNYEITATSSLTTTQVLAFITTISASMDARLRRMYTLPITNTEDLQLLNGICADLTTSELLSALFLTTQQPNGIPESAALAAGPSRRLLVELSVGFSRLATPLTGTPDAIASLDGDSVRLQPSADGDAGGVLPPASSSFSGVDDDAACPP